MLPSSHSFRGRWTCRSTARIKSGGQGLCFFLGNSIADADRAAVYDASHHPTPAHEFVFQTHADFIHPKARFAHLRDFQHCRSPEEQPAAWRILHDIEALDREVLFDGARVRSEER